ncbi:ABC transporter permease [Saxibacter everestensis]|uniref:ABC transporter permease n=1 Tax=Saxibacter everestensis TaxID=2909229 RepID=A0ABY8QR57_9MICO|nr:ABC transporter permease [Brevibacteriaceae bacterium ZFBP1038]
MALDTLTPETPEIKPRPAEARPPKGRKSMWLLLLPMLVVFAAGFALPLLNVARFSLDRFDAAQGGQVPAWSMEQFLAVFSNELYRELIFRTFGLALATTLISIVLCYPLALAVTRGPRRLRGILMAVVMTPLMVSVVVKTFGWSVLLSGDGILQQALNATGLDIRLLFTPVGVTIGLVHTYMPFMALSLIAALAAIDRRTEEAATSLGSPPFKVFLKVTLPQTVNGLAAGSVLTFVTSMSALVTPQLLGGGRVSTIVTAIYDQATSGQNWPLASALGVVLLIITFIMLSLQALAVRRATN